MNLVNDHTHTHTRALQQQTTHVYIKLVLSEVCNKGCGAFRISQVQCLQSSEREYLDPDVARLPDSVKIKLVSHHHENILHKLLHADTLLHSRCL